MVSPRCFFVQKGFFVNEIITLPRLGKSFFSRDAAVLAPDLIGKIFVKVEEGSVLAGQITEVEAYTGFNDPADHAFKGLTARNKSLFLDAGHLYIHSIHRYFCLDIVSDSPRSPGSVLIRSMKPLAGVEVMEVRRMTKNETQLLSGPGKICQAFGIDKSFDGSCITQSESEIFLTEAKDHPSYKIVSSSRIGISKAVEKELRFCMADSKFLSR